MKGPLSLLGHLQKSKMYLLEMSLPEHAVLEPDVNIRLDVGRQSNIYQHQHQGSEPLCSLVTR